MPDHVRAAEDRFCENCGVSRDLHPTTHDPEPWACQAAEAKADLLDRFGGLLDGR